MKPVRLSITAAVLAATTFMSYAPEAHAAWGRKKKEQQQAATQLPAPQAAPESRELLQDLLSKVTRNFDQLNILMSQGKYESAMTLAKQSLDEARLKTGLDPKSNRKEIITVPTGTFASSYDRMGKALTDFPISTQNAIMRSIELHKGGYFLDLLNLLKRTNLVYIQAFHQTLKRSPVGLLSEDVAKIRNDINAVRAIPLYLQEEGQKTPLLIFDYEVANSDQNYMFNRELKTYLLSQGQDLGYHGESLEQTIDQELKNRVTQLVQKFISTENPRSAQSTDSNPFENANYKACLIAYDNLYSHQSQTICIQKYLRFSYLSSTFKSCHRQASESLYSSQASERCESYAKIN